MDKKLLIRVDTLLRHINEVLNDLQNISFDEFEKSSLLQRATSFSSSQIGEIMIKLQESLEEKYPDLPWKDARRMRNFIVHDYVNIEIEDVYKTAKNDLPILKTAFEQIRENLK